MTDDKLAKLARRLRRVRATELYEAEAGTLRQLEQESRDMQRLCAQVLKEREEGAS